MRAMTFRDSITLKKLQDPYGHSSGKSVLSEKTVSSPFRGFTFRQQVKAQAEKPISPLIYGAVTLKATATIMRKFPVFSTA